VTPKCLDILSLPVRDIDLRGAVEWAEERVLSRKPAYICHVNVHTLAESWRNPALRGALSEADLAVADGMPLVWLAHRQNGRSTERVYGPDFMTAMLDRAGPAPDRPWRHFFYGSTPLVMEGLLKSVADRFPGASVAGHITPPFRASTDSERDADRRAINASGADIVWVGLGAPRQEIWMHQNRTQLEPPLLVGAGAAFEFLAGTKPQAPRWMQRSGLEWSFRLLTEPRRLGPRYARTIPPFLWRVLSNEMAGWRQRR